MIPDEPIPHPGPTLPFDGGPKPSRAGDILVAWLARGDNAEGRGVFLSGHISAGSVDEAKKIVGDGFAALEVDPPCLKPVGGVMLYCWEIPNWHMAAVLKANGYEVNAPPTPDVPTECPGCKFPVNLSPFVISDTWTCPKCKSVNPRPKP